MLSFVLRVVKVLRVVLDIVDRITPMFTEVCNDGENEATTGERTEA